MTIELLPFVAGVTFAAYLSLLILRSDGSVPSAYRDRFLSFGGCACGDRPLMCAGLASAQFGDGDDIRVTDPKDPRYNRDRQRQRDGVLW